MDKFSIIFLMNFRFTFVFRLFLLSPLKVGSNWLWRDSNCSWLKQTYRTCNSFWVIESFTITKIDSRHISWILFYLTTLIFDNYPHCLSIATTLITYTMMKHRMVVDQISKTLKEKCEMKHPVYCDMILLIFPHMYHILNLQR